jgi:hypothetical protein
VTHDKAWPCWRRRIPLIFRRQIALLCDSQRIDRLHERVSRSRRDKLARGLHPAARKTQLDRESVRRMGAATTSCGPHAAGGERYCHLLREESKPCEPEIGTELWTWKKPTTRPWSEAKPIAIRSAGAARPGPQNAVHLESPVRTPKSASPADAIAAGAGSSHNSRFARKHLAFALEPELSPILGRNSRLSNCRSALLADAESLVVFRSASRALCRGAAARSCSFLWRPL